MSETVAFRLANWDTPLWVSPNRRDSRYLPAGGKIVQYWSLNPLTCWAEHLRFHDIRDSDDVRELRARPWAGLIELPSGVLDISFGNAEDHGIAPAALVDDDWTVCQQWAARLDVPGIIVPSAALPGTRNLVLFGPKVRIPWGIAPLDPEVDVPCDPIADSALGLVDLLRSVRWRGQAHVGYEAWARGEPRPPPPAVRVDHLT